jgi:hypothetical protein
MSLSTPVAFIIFNRPDLTKQVFAAISKAKPKQLFVIADGPRFPEEAEKCNAARSVIEKVDWDCEVLKNYSETNLGCGYRPASGIDWVFSQVEEAIFLEDDTLPSPSFFNFCQELLEYYRYDTRVMTISGDNYQQGQSRTNQYSYYFSKYPLTCGWASWRRAWKYYDYRIRSWPIFKQGDLLEFICLDPYELKFWTNIFDQMHQDPEVIKAWDFQWTYTCFSQNGLCATPNTNLISNLGFREDASHIRDENEPRANLPLTNIWEIKHPPFVIANLDAASFEFDNTYYGNSMKSDYILIPKIRIVLSRIKKIAIKMFAFLARIRLIMEKLIN